MQWMDFQKKDFSTELPLNIKIGTIHPIYSSPNIREVVNLRVKGRGTVS